MVEQVDKDVKIRIQTRDLGEGWDSSIYLCICQTEAHLSFTCPPLTSSLGGKCGSQLSRKGTRMGEGSGKEPAWHLGYAALPWKLPAFL